MSEKTDLVPANKEKTSSLIPKLNEYEIKEARCKLCNSMYRAEAEALFEKTRSFSRVHKLLTEKHEEDISPNAVSNHLKFHYISQGNNALIREFAEEIKPWFEHQDDQKSAMVRTISILERQMWTLSSQMEGMSDEEQRKSADTVKKIADTLLAYRGKLSEMERSLEPVNIVLNQLQVIIQDEVSGDPSAVNFAKRVLHRLEDACGDIVIEQQQ